MKTAVLSFGIEFLGPVILADPSRPDCAEWPPAPARVYAALVAAACDHGLGEDVVRALQALEGTAPAITAPHASFYPAHRIAVPTAHTFRGLALMAAPEVFPASPVVSYHWPVAADAAPLIGRAVRRLSHVGRGESLVLGDVYAAERVPEPNLVPDRTGDLYLRVPTAGRYQTLERDYLRGRCSASLDPAQPYRWLAGDAPATAQTGPWGRLIALRTKPCDIRSAAHLAEGLRAAVLARLGDDAPAQIHGHGTHDHVAWLALPHIGGEHGDGSVLGVAALLPANMEPEAERALLTALAGLRGIPLRGRRIPVSLPAQALATLQSATWSRPSRLWASATPLVLEHRVGTDARRAVAQAIARAGYPRPIRVESGVVPYLRGAVHASETYPRREHDLPRRHALVEFAEPVTGPLLAGGERYFGLGLFKPLPFARTGND
ncbi:type I-U CRISPR-associated protein Csb2 [Methylococcus sp. EFPC2]|uniref:type I-G CRISPR-associated protein Csb2 n=1 Tax=Methylococcus sp. EFPC2 TaxID=2812648 RepID=UPI001966ED15|nr:type I-U CRISPR-associated protein Csb2 [Methylococcus sp. EFPC2]QSA97551.1 type I-U CRISPR-associated protein Cas5/Cas6 [Methylococcus sp. EFPC2]